jgi:inosose dehydratase
MERRSFLQLLLAGASSLQAIEPAKAWHIGCGFYPWHTFSKRGGPQYGNITDVTLEAVAAAGLKGYEPNFEAPAVAADLGARLKKHGLEMRSIYVNSTLHDKVASQASIDSVLAIAKAAGELGTKVVVTNPSPIKWGGAEAKSDDQLRHQAESLNNLGAALGKMGMQLAYHNHDIELRQGGREFHHMLTGTDASHVHFCLDAHWVYRGCGDSEVAVFDALEHYGSRIVELHLRQSIKGAWTEAFAAKGDLDYTKIYAWLQKHDRKPLLILEQAIEATSPHTLDAVAAHKASLEAVVGLIS